MEEQQGEGEDPAILLETTEELELIKQAVADIPRIERHVKNANAVITEFDLGTLPTGTLIVTRAYGHIVGYHSNDIHTHCSLLVWCSTDGEDRFSLYYEPGKTRPMNLELTTSLTRFSCNLLLSEYPDVIKDHEFGFRPRDFLLEHPRYLDVVKKIVLSFPLLFSFNDCEYSFRHKYAPLIYPSFKSYHHNPREFFKIIKDDPLKKSTQNTRLFNLSCIDTISLYISLLHEELFINLTPQEISEGQTPDTNVRLNSPEVMDYDIARLIKPDSPVFEFYNREPEKMMRGVFKVTTKLDYHAGIFLLPYLLSFVIFTVVCVFLKFIIPRLVFSKFS